MKIQRPRGKLICVELDGVLCQRGFPETNPNPIHEAILKVTELHEMGAHILISTTRLEKWYPETKAWLIKMRVPFIGIAMRHRPQADYYIDKNAVNADDWMADRTKLRSERIRQADSLTGGALIC